MAYTKLGPFVDGGAPYLSAANLNHLEAGIAATGAVFNVRDTQYAGGAKGDGSTDDTAAIQAAIAACLTAGGGTVYFPMPAPGYSYRYSQIVIDRAGLGSNYTFIALVGDTGGVMLRPFSNITTPSVVVTSSNATGGDSAGDKFIENVTLRNLNFSNGYLNGQQDASLNRVGVQIANAQNLVLDNVTIQGFWQQGLQLLSVEDSKFTNLNVFWCGHATSDTDYAYGIEFGAWTNGTVTNGGCNALQFANFHIDQCPLELHFAKTEMGVVVFTGGKLERQHYTDTTTKNRLWFEDALQVAFEGVSFTEDGASSKYLISAIQADTSYMTSANVRRHIKFTNCVFNGAYVSGTAWTLWAVGNYLTFASCTFVRTLGTNTAGAFALGNGSKILGCEITLATNDINVFGVTGPNVTIRDVLIQNPDAAVSNGSLFTFSGAYDGVTVDGIGLVGKFSNAINGSASPTYLGNGRYARPLTFSDAVATSATKSVFLVDKVTLTPSSATNFTGAGLLFAHNGKTLTVYASNGNSTLVHDPAALYLRGAANRTLTAGATVQLYNDAGIWREI